ncbi:hypothetical protein LTR66_004005 [Elasticomyces elasticus]|nr:hypothetical protein LTR66_004005 [Elasticomyces elasticus]
MDSIPVTPWAPFLQPDAGSSVAGSASDHRSVRTAEVDDEVKSGRAWAHEVRDPWDACILTLDGGGIRGYSSLLILQALFHEIHTIEMELEALEPLGGPFASFNEDELLPCHYFDFMHGTSTGGLIGTMLGRLRMTLSECLSLYRKVGNDLFGHRRSNIPLRTKYYHKPLEAAVQEIVAKRCDEHEECDGKDHWHPWDILANDLERPFNPHEPRICQSCCLTAKDDSNVSVAHLLRTYAHWYNDDTPRWITEYNQGADKIKIWEATRATSAAPFYFEMLEAEVSNELTQYLDGGIRENNPSGAAWSEHHSMYLGGEEPALLLSIGTGRPDHSQDGFATAWPGPFGRLTVVRKALQKRAIFLNLLIKYTEGEKQHEAMKGHARGENTWYKRLNVSAGLETMPLDSWITGPWTDPATGNTVDTPGGTSLTQMQDVTRLYLTRDFDPHYDDYAPPSTILRQTAEKLVRQRRAREKLGGERWAVFVGERPVPVR